MTRLGVDYLNLYIIHRFDLYIIHRFDYSTPMAETMEALDRLVRDGRARALGASAMYGYQLHNLQRVGRRERMDALIEPAEPLQPALPRGRARAHPGRAASTA